MRIKSKGQECKLLTFEALAYEADGIRTRNLRIDSPVLSLVK